MVEIPDSQDEAAELGDFGVVTSASAVTAWFAREVLPLEPALMQFLRHSRRDQGDVEDLCQEVFVRVYESARQEIPEPAKPFVFTVARNLLLDRVRRDAIVSIETVADLDALGLAADEPGPDRSAIGASQ